MGVQRQPAVIRFGTYEISLRSGELRKAGSLIRIQQQPLKLLRLLLQHSGEVVTRDELRSQLWPGENFGDFDQAVNAAVAKLRYALGDAADNPRFIETIPKLGYRFLVNVTVEYAETFEEESSASKEHLENQQEGSDVLVEAAPVKRRNHRIVLLTASGFVLLAVIAGMIFSKAKSGPRATSKVRSLAVLPLDNLSGDRSQDFFADGMTDELTTDLAQIKDLKVISRTSAMMYKGTHKPLPEIARDLSVDAVVEGSVIRSGDRIRIAAQLIRGATDEHLWAKSYDGDVRDSLALQHKVARAIAEQVQIKLTPQEEGLLASTTTVDPEAYDDYLRGRYLWNKRTTNGLELAVDYFDQSIAKDPKYAGSYSGLADTYALLGDWQYAAMTATEALPKAKAAAIKALELDDTLSEAHTSLAFTLDGYDWDLRAAGQEFQLAIELNPGYATAHHWYAWHLALFAQYDQAIAEMRKAQALDPLSLIIRADLAELLLIAGFNEQSVQQSLRTIDMDPDFAMAHNQLGQAYLANRMPDKAILELQKAVELSDGSPSSSANLARAFAFIGERKKAFSIIHQLREGSRPGLSHAAEIAAIYTSLGDSDEAIMWLEIGAKEKFNPGVLIRPSFDPLRSDPRFKNLLHRVGLPGS